jgi:hypothetical protein
MKRTNVQDERRSSRLVSWFIRFSHRRQVYGLPVAVWGNDPLDPVVEKIRDAVGFVRDHDARAFRELANHTRGIFVFGTTGGDAAEWWRDEGLIVLKPEYASDPGTTWPAIAVILVHEAAHAWLERRGFVYAVERRARLEGVCNRRALRLARRLPDAEDLVVWLKGERQPEELSDEAFHQRAVAELVRLGMPPWLVRQMEFWSKRLGRLTRACSG